MHKILARSVSTPTNASYVKVAKKSGRVLTLEYYTINGAPIRYNVPHSATVVTEEVYQKMVKAPKAPTAPKPAADPTRKDQDKKKDLPFGKNLTNAEKEELKRYADANELEADHQAAPVNPIKKRAKVPVGTARGKGADTERPKGVKEANDGSQYGVEAIRRALFAAKLAEEDIKAVLLNLAGSEVVVDSVQPKKGMSFSQLVQRLSEAPFKGPAADSADAAQANFEADMNDQEDQSEKIKVGMDEDDVGDLLINVSKNDVDTIKNLPRGTVIKYVVIENGKVAKVVKTRLLSTPESAGSITGKVTVDNKKVELTLGRGSTIYLRQDPTTKQYVLVKDSREDQPPSFNFEGQDNGN
jgi:hypothetical protein